jgi:hypothetical protein
MKRGLVLLLFAILLAAAAGAADYERPNHLRVSEILFPETGDWQAVDSLPTPDAEEMLRNKEDLRSVYLATRRDGLMEAPECSFITRALDEYFDVERFRVADFDGDGFEDVMYSGSALCSEGYVAVIWFGGESGLSKRPVKIVPFKLLKTELEGGRGMSSVQPGCCGDIVDTYFVGDLVNPRRFARARVDCALSVPAEMEPVSEEYASRDTLVLRHDPLKDDEYDRIASEALAHAVFGNVVAEYLPGAKGRIVARFEDDEGARWGLLIVDEASHALRIGAPERINVGWVSLK